MRDGAYIILVIVIIILIIGGVYWYQNSRNPMYSINLNNQTSSDTSQGLNKVFSLRSVFDDGSSIPKEYTCEGGNYSPPLSWNNAPTTTKSFALTMYDPDVPKAVKKEGFFDHWVLYNISSTTTDLSASTTVGTLGKNGSGKNAYTGPCPPTQYEPKEHRYIFSLYALDKELSFAKSPTRAQLEEAVYGHILGQAVLTGKYQKMATTTP